MRASLTAMPAEQPTYLSRFIPDPVGFYWLGRLPQSSEYLDNRKVTALLQTQEDSMPSYLKGIIEDNKFRIHRNEGFLVKWASEL